MLTLHALPVFFAQKRKNDYALTGSRRLGHFLLCDFSLNIPYFVAITQGNLADAA